MGTSLRLDIIRGDTGPLLTDCRLDVICRQDTAVEVHVHPDGRVLQVSVDGVCLFQVHRIRKLDVQDGRWTHAVVVEDQDRDPQLRVLGPCSEEQAIATKDEMDLEALAADAQSVYVVKLNEPRGEEARYGLG